MPYMALWQPIISPTIKQQRNVGGRRAPHGSGQTRTRTNSYDRKLVIKLCCGTVLINPI